MIPELTNKEITELVIIKATHNNDLWALEPAELLEKYIMLALEEKDTQ